ncbi:MAG TPA: GNAT family N-acetyltransferase, partial [Ktedonobacterales bacterium]
MSEIVCDVSPESLARANEANLAEGLAACVGAYGGEVYDEPDLLWCAVGISSAGWNRVPRAQLTPETLDARIEWVIARAQALHVPFLWNVGPSTQPVGLGAHLMRHGLTHDEDEPAMGVALADLPGALPALEGVTVERVQDRAALEQWARTLYAGFEAPASTVGPFLAAVSRDDLGDAAAAHYYLARLHGEPVATAALSLAAGVAGVFAVATVERARRRGIGAAITLAPLLDARARGYAVGVLQASEMGHPVYARLGFS